jgi:Tol biopolymer transport system component/DNA-binding winged helix-turn-helix (wHTH) protein
MSGDFVVGEWRVQPAINRLRRGDQVVRVEPKVMQVLVCLSEHTGEVVTREQLIARVWPDVFVTDDVLHRAIRELRRVFGDSTAEPRYIETIRKRGYRLLLPAAPAATSDPKDLEIGVRGRSEGRRESAIFAAIAAGIALAVAAAVIVLATRTSDLSPQAHARFVPIVSGPLNESDPAVSPDGRLIAFVQREPGLAASADIYIRSLADGVITRVTEHPASNRMPAWSPDGSRLAFVRETTHTCDIIVRTLTSGAEARAAACANRDEPRVAWTHDGVALLVSQAPAGGSGAPWRIARLDLSRGTLTPITTPPASMRGDHSPALSPSGDRIAFIRRASSGMADIYITSLAGESTRRLTNDDADLAGIDWSDDGRTIVFSSDRAGGYSLWRVPTEGGTPVLLAGGGARMKHPVADRAARRVVYENWSYEINVWQVNESGDAPITRTSELWNLYPQVSPDGARLTYVSTQSGSHELWVADRDGRNARQLTRGMGAVKMPRWSPDSRRIAFVARGRGGSDVHSVDVATGDGDPDHQQSSQRDCAGLVARRDAHRVRRTR